MRDGDRDKIKPYLAYLKLIITATSKLPSTNGIFYRGIKADLNEQYIIGETIIWQEFSSCTESVALLESDMFLGHTGVRTLFNIECNSGKMIRVHSYYPNENEILLLPATQFLVKEILNPTPDFHIIYLKQITSEFSPLKSTLVTTTHMSSTMADDIEEDEIPIYENEKLEACIRRMRLSKVATFYVETLHNDDMRMIANELRTNRLWKSLKIIGHNKIDDNGAEYFLEALTTNPSVTQLFFGRNSLGNTGIKPFAYFLSSNNTVTDEGRSSSD